MGNTDKPRLVYGANRQIGLEGLELLLEAGLNPVALLLPTKVSAEYVAEMRRLAPDAPILWGKEFRESEGLAKLAELRPDYVLSVHFPYIITREVLDVPSIGTLNLHPALLPFNKGWHTPTWAILENKPYGATLHWVDEGIDTGDIALQRAVKVNPDDTANSLYHRVLAVEIEVLKDALPLLLERKLPRVEQSEEGTLHTKSALSVVQELDLNRQTSAREVIKLLRGLTTNNWQEAAYFEADGARYALRVDIKKIEEGLL